MASMNGRPNFDDEDGGGLLDGDASVTKGDTANNSTREDGNGCGDDDDDDWGAPVSSSHLACSGSQNHRATRNRSLNASFGLFAPEPVVGLGPSDRPLLPGLPVSSLPTGTKVWLTDAEDIATILKENWHEELVPFCGGARSGVVVRHSDQVTLVAFDPPSPGVASSLNAGGGHSASAEDAPREAHSVPRVALSITPIPPYASSYKARSHAVAGGGELGPRAGRVAQRPDNGTNGGAGAGGARASTVLTAYDNVSLPPLTLPASIAALESVKARGFAEAISALSLALDSLGKPSDVAVERELRAVRCVAALHLGMLTDALSDALCCIELSPSWTFGYVCASRVYSAMGKFMTARQLALQASVLLPSNSALDWAFHWQGAMADHESSLSNSGVQVRVDYCGLKKVFARRKFALGDVVFKEEPIVAVLSTQNSVRACLVTFAVGSQLAPRDCTEQLFASDAAYLRALGSFQRYDSGPNARAVKSALGIINDKAISSLVKKPLEAALVCVRLVSMLSQRLEATNDFGESRVRSEMRALHLYPTPILALDDKQRGDLETLHRVLFSCASPALAAAFPISVFSDLYLFCLAYTVTLPLVVEGATSSYTVMLNVLSRVVSCLTQTSKVAVALASPSSVVAVTTAEVAPQESLTA